LPAFEYRLDLYDHLGARREQILAEAESIGKGLGIPAELKGTFGTSGTHSALPGSIRRDILQAIDAGMRKIGPLKYVGDEIRRTVKSVYGDAYDAAPANSCEAALEIAFDALLSPPLMGRGEPYRARCIGPIERHSEHHLSYGRPFPSMYKDLFADRGATAGELGLLGRRKAHTDVVMVPMVGASYELHGVKFYPCPLLMNTDARATVKALRRAAEIHVRDLCGFLSLGYDTVGYGYGEKEADGTPVLLRGISGLAADYGVPYVCDNAWGLPFLGTDPRTVGADVMLYSMDKVAGAPTSGLVIGREGAMVGIRRALGVQGERFGATSAHGKASYAGADPGKVAMTGILAALRVLRDQPEVVTRPIDVTHEIVLDEYQRAKRTLGEGITISKSYNLGGVEVNYEGTWSDGRMGIPIFNNEDRVAGSQLLSLSLARMGVLPGQAEDANVIITPGLGTVDQDGAVLEVPMRLAARAVFAVLALLGEWAQKKPGR
jgi:hypothetical protein